MSELTPEQSRAARGLLNWSQARLGGKANLSESTIRDFEKGRRTPLGSKPRIIRAALEAAGVVFLSNGETASGGPGVRLQDTQVPTTLLRDGEAGIIDNSEM